MKLLSIAAAVLMLAAGWRALRHWRGRHRARAGRPLRRARSPFDAPAWPDAGPLPLGSHRPPEIELSDSRILPPPREIRGKYGE